MGGNSFEDSLLDGITNQDHGSKERVVATPGGESGRSGQKRTGRASFRNKSHAAKA